MTRVPQPGVVGNAGGKTLVTNAGSNGKFLAVLDLDLGKGARQGCALSAAAGLCRTCSSPIATCRR